MILKDRRGYMLVEIVLASAIAFGIAYFIVSLTVKLKNKNDDALVMSQVATDQAIITNGFMRYAMEEKADFDCSLVNVSDNTVKYGDEVIDIVSKYATIKPLDENSCKVDNSEINIKIELEVLQLEEKYNVDINYKYDMLIPNLEILFENEKYKIKLSDDRGIKNDTYDIRYGYYNGEPKCNDLESLTSIIVNDNDKEIIQELDVIPGGEYIFYICNSEDIVNTEGKMLKSGTVFVGPIEPR